MIDAMSESLEKCVFVFLCRVRMEVSRCRSLEQIKTERWNSLTD